MLSKISIGVAPNKTACIKVEERKSDDVRDDLVQMMREELHHRSNTFTMCDINQSTTGEITYLLLPVSDELKYIDGIIKQKYIYDYNSRENLANLIVAINGGILDSISDNKDREIFAVNMIESLRAHVHEWIGKEHDATDQIFDAMISKVSVNILKK